MGFGVWGLGFGVSGFGFRVWGLGFGRVCCLGVYRVEDWDIVGIRRIECAGLQGFGSMWRLGFEGFLGLHEELIQITDP